MFKCSDMNFNFTINFMDMKKMRKEKKKTQNHFDDL